MANGEILREIHDMLEGGKFSTPNALRLSLTLQAQTYTKLDDMEKRVAALEKKEEDTANKSLINLAERHPKITLAIVVTMLAIDVRAMITFVLQTLGLTH